ncbi:hypothetical protein PENSOL_c164G09093 [Penicillium solitum]|uniref:Integrase catalytic domain-containing protein n=1 Tax=Penicillium solitum TaxID=60172 RepID=A0A1V6Q127_9EURO|nr:uncharacterized protein PENSOL_c164G09093 [Penicillium solitum]OQD82988.1 hypothetical protein PENSOL_c164G09093 [Penicillium solitum]
MIKELLISAPILKQPDRNKPYTIETDTSEWALGLYGAELNYPVHKKELLAIKEAIRTWDRYIDGDRFETTIITDNTSLQYLNTTKEYSKRLARLREYRGGRNQPTTRLSRKRTRQQDGTEPDDRATARVVKKFITNLSFRDVLIDRNAPAEIITAIDYATRWPVSRAVPDAIEEVLAEFLYRDIYTHYGAFTELISDNGPNLLSGAVRHLVALIQARHHTTIPYHPRKPTRLWDEYLTQAVFTARVREHVVSKRSPYYLVYGVHPRVLSDESHPLDTHPQEDREEQIRYLSDARSKANELLLVHAIKKRQIRDTAASPAGRSALRRAGIKINRPEELRRVLNEVEPPPPTYADLSTFTRAEWQEFKRIGTRREFVGEDVIAEHLIAKTRA